jgi:hypothetical protein
MFKDAKKQADDAMQQAMSQAGAQGTPAAPTDIRKSSARP